MAYEELLEEQREETRAIIEELLEDGSDPDALYTIEHHLSSDSFDALEKRRSMRSSWAMRSPTRKSWSWKMAQP